MVVITHDHYDHLDYKTIKKLESKTNMFYVPLGVEAHLIHWGKYKLSLHSWTEPIERATIAAKNENVLLMNPKIGEIITLN